jgi:hypothetical protein
VTSSDLSNPAGFADSARRRLSVSLLKSVLPMRSELLHPIRYLSDHRFSERLRSEGYTGIGSRRTRALIEAARSVDRRGVSGALVDCGVWNGGSTILLGAGAPEREVWAFDSFQGMPEPGPEDVGVDPGWSGHVVGSEAKLREGFARYSGRPERLHVVPGWFEDTLAPAAPEIGDIAVLHVDADWYAPCLLVLETFYPRLRRGGIVLIDDLRLWEGARRACADYRQAQGIDSPIIASHYWVKDEG